MNYFLKYLLKQYNNYFLSLTIYTNIYVLLLTLYNNYIYNIYVIMTMITHLKNIMPYINFTLYNFQREININITIKLKLLNLINFCLIKKIVFG